MVKKIVKFSLLILFLAAILVTGYFYFQHKSLYPSTDDAYIQAHVVYIAPRVDGQVSRVYIQNHQKIKKGQLLFTLQKTPYTLAVQKAQAALTNTLQSVSAQQTAVQTAKAMVAQRKADVVDAQKMHARTMTLVKKHLYAMAAGDNAVRQYTVAKAALKAAQTQLQQAKQTLGKPGDANARVREAKAELALAKLNLTHTTVRAPASGYIAKLSLQKGTEVTAYETLFAIVKDHLYWASANYKETDLARIHPGQTATIKVDMYPNHVFKGKVTSISAGSGASFALLPPENATGNWVKVTQRFPVRVDLTKPDPKFPLRIGASCTVTIDTQSR